MGASFNSRTLGRVRPCLSFLVVHLIPVSIHAPWEGCDFNSFYSCHLCDSFNSRTLGRVRPSTDEMSRDERVVSIHAPWEGCDRNTLELLNTNLQFQFTHPGKGATPPMYSLICVTSCFNSRTLGRVRLYL